VLPVLEFLPWMTEPIECCPLYKSMLRRPLS
jgi:hypothetical protein